MKDNTEYLKEQGYGKASDMAEIVFQIMLQKEQEGDLYAVRNYKPEQVREIMERKIQILSAKRVVTLEYFSIILGDPNNPQERRLFIMQYNESAESWDLWERREDEILPFLNQSPNIPDFYFKNHSFEDLMNQATDPTIKRREIML